MQRWVGAACALLVTAWSATGNAFCGFYVGSSSELKNDATQVVLMRHGRHTVMSIQNNYEGPPEDFALVVPVPTVLREQDVRTLPREVFDRVDRLTSPRLVEYWEQDPCPDLSGGLLGTGHGSGFGLGTLGTMGRGAGSRYGIEAPRPVVRVEAEFAVDEYDIAILSADESSGLETWLRSHGYRIPRGAARMLRPYVEAGTKFFVARVDASRLSFDGRRAQLSPLRVHYESDQLSLPIRLGMLNARGPQDLIVHVLAPSRFEVANRPNVNIPTNLRVAAHVRDRFSTFYSALYDATVRENPGAVVTEYAWAPSGCDPCPGPVLSRNDIASLGGDATAQTEAPLAPAPQLAIRGRFVSLSEPESDDDVAALFARRGLRRGARALDACFVRAAMSGRIPSQGSLQAHLGAVLIPGSDPVVQLAGPIPPVVAGCLRNAGRRALSGDAPIDGVQTVRAQLNATWQVARRAQLPPMTLTRMHFRYTPHDSPDDLVFREVGGLVGGRGTPTPDGNMAPDTASPMGSMSSFQGRYAILHPWTGPIACDAPRRGMWGGAPTGLGAGAAVHAAEDLGEVRSRRLSLERALLSPVPELGLAPRPQPRRAPRAAGKGGALRLTAHAPRIAMSRGALVGCAVSDRSSGPGGVAGLVLGLGLLLSCRRRAGRRPRRSRPARRG